VPQVDSLLDHVQFHSFLLTSFWEFNLFCYRLWFLHWWHSKIDFPFCHFALSNKSSCWKNACNSEPSTSLYTHAWRCPTSRPSLAPFYTAPSTSDNFFLFSGRLRRLSFLPWSNVEQPPSILLTSRICKLHNSWLASYTTQWEACWAHNLIVIVCLSAIVAIKGS